MIHQLLRGIGKVGALVIGSGGSILKKVQLSTVSLNPASISTVTRGSVTFTLTGARAGDVVVMNPPAALNDDLVFAGCAVTANDTVSVYLYNPTGGAIDDAAQTWTYSWFQKG